MKRISAYIELFIRGKSPGGGNVRGECPDTPCTALNKIWDVGSINLQYTKLFIVTSATKIRFSVWFKILAYIVWSSDIAIDLALFSKYCKWRQWPGSGTAFNLIWRILWRVYRFATVIGLFSNPHRMQKRVDGGRSHYYRVHVGQQKIGKDYSVTTYANLICHTKAFSELCEGLGRQRKLFQFTDSFRPTHRRQSV